jgi:hypothetical protein
VSAVAHRARPREDSRGGRVLGGKMPAGGNPMTRIQAGSCSLLALALAVGGGCKSEEQKQQEQAAQRMQAAANEMGQAAKQLGTQGAAQGMEGAASGMMNAAQAMKNATEAMKKMAGGGGTAYQPVDFRELKALLPDELAGCKRTSATGERAGAMGFNIAQAEGKYESAAGGHLRVKLLDIGSSVGPLAMATMGWGLVEIDRETETGYEKTTKIGGRKGYEKYDKGNKSGEVKVLVGTRFLVEIAGNELAMDDMKGALGKIDLAKLEGLKPVAAAN